MYYSQWVILSTLITLAANTEDLSFPPGFIFGAGTSSYQIEGAWNVSGKTESIWDTFLHKSPHSVKDGSNGDLACDSYHQWQRDVDIAAELGLHFYRFSVSWPRLLPTGFGNRINEDGKNYYNNLINGLLEKGIQPVITIFHWDLPQRFQDLGGWANPLIVDWFAEYSRVVFSLYADRVKIWVTINEPIAVCDFGYQKFFAPGILDYNFGRYLCSKNILLAHAMAWRIYDEEFRPTYHGLIAITNHMLWADPLSENEKEAAEVSAQQFIGRFSHPIYSKEGGWPPALKEILAKSSAEEGYDFSRLPDFTQEEIELIRGTFDYYGMNYYTGRLVRKGRKGEPKAKLPFEGDEDTNLKFEINPEWKETGSVWYKQYPEGFRRAMQWIKKQYGDIKVFVTEVGYSTNHYDLDDYGRIECYKSYMNQMLLAIKEDKINVIGFTIWSLMDNFEWLDGYGPKFGLYSVNFTDPNRRRTPKMSAKFYANVIRKHSLDVPDKY